LVEVDVVTKTKVIEMRLLGQRQRYQEGPPRGPRT
jgi:hypothetical protein